MEEERKIKVVDNKAITDVSKVLNINVGMLGHIDSGKTSISKLISTIASTSAFDKVPQSQERGITLELGFSAFLIEIPEFLKKKHAELGGYDYIQFTLVDCPGHASLIKTIIGGASIIDLMVLVIDCTKGIQTQTAECMVIGEILKKRLMIALNKVDLWPEGEREEKIETTTKKLRAIFKDSFFGPDIPINPVIAASSKEASSLSDIQAKYLDNFLNSLLDYINIPTRSLTGPFIFSADHCFAIKGQGTVLTGTVISGKGEVGDILEIPSINESKKIKSMQIFRKPVPKACQGDRVGICVVQLDSKTFERGFAAKKGNLKAFDSCLVRLRKVKYYKHDISSKAKFHITLGHQTILGTCFFFNLLEGTSGPSAPAKAGEEAKINPIKGMYEEKLTDLEWHTALIKFEAPVYGYQGCIIIGSKLDFDVNIKQCRIAFEGEILDILSEPQLNAISLLRNKTRVGKIEKVLDGNTLLIKELFKKETNFDIFLGKKVRIAKLGIEGVLDSTFGKSGKVKVVTSSLIPPEKYEELVNSEVEMTIQKRLFKSKKPAK